MEYDIKRGHYSNIEGSRLESIMRESFGEVDFEGDTLISSYGAMRKIKVRVLDKSALSIETESSTDVQDEVALDTIRKYNDFLEKVTGFNSKQRRDRLNKKAKEGKL